MIRTEIAAYAFIDANSSAYLPCTRHHYSLAWSVTLA